MASDELDFFNLDSSAEGLEERVKMLQHGVKNRVHISHGEEIDPSLIVRAIQMRYDHCSSKHIAAVLALEEDVVSSIIQKDQEILQEYIDRVKVNDELKLNRAARTLNELKEQAKEFGQWAFYDGEYDYSLEVLQLPTKREVTEYRSKNFLKERLNSISNYRGLDTTMFNWIKDKPFVYEFAFINRDRIYHLIRMISENSMGFIAEKCWQLYHEGFQTEEIDELFENRSATAFKDLSKHINLTIDRRNNSIYQTPKKTKSNTEPKFRESLHIINNSSSNDIEFYMNINTGNGKVKSIRSIFRG